VNLRLRVNPIACEAHGLCAELFPERITLDEWGYPIVDPRPIPSSLEKNAKRAARACPRLALLLERELRVRS
jgi:ferredoxin